MRICSFGAEASRSWTDVFSNQTYISSLVAEFNHTDVLQGRVPFHCLPDFLHEACHHWCLNSPVGTALAVLDWNRRRAREQDSTEGRLQFLEYSGRVEWTVSMLRPLFEGLALFAEMDATPGHTQIISEPMLLVMLLFLREQVRYSESTGGAFETLFATLSERRMYKDIIDRKVELLSSPLISEEGYLSGYLFVKRLFTTSLALTRLGSDSDFSLNFLQHYFFHDYELVDILLAPASPATNEIQNRFANLYEYLSHRLTFADTIDELDEDTSAFEQAKLKMTRDEASRPQTPEEYEAYEELAIRDDFSSPASDMLKTRHGKQRLIDVMKGIGEFSDESLRLALAQRSLLHIISYPSTIFASEGSFVASDKYGPLVAGKLERTFAGVDPIEGSVDLVVDTYHTIEAISVSAGSEVIAISLTGPGSTLLERQFKSYTIAHAIRDSTSQQEMKRTTARLTALGLDKEALRNWNAISNTVTLVCRIALGVVTQDRYEECVASMREVGFLGLTNHDDVRTLAVLSFIDGHGAFLEETHIAGESVPLSQELERLDKLFCKKFGRSIFIRTASVEGTRVISLV